MSASLLQNLCLTLRNSGMSTFAVTSALVQWFTGTDVSSLYPWVSTYSLTVCYFSCFPTIGLIHINRCLQSVNLKHFACMFVPVFEHSPLSFSQAAGSASSHQWEGCKHRSAGVILFQTKESPGGGNGPEEGERPTHAPTQTAGTASVCDHQASHKCM